MTSVADPTTPREWEDFIHTKLSTPEEGMKAVQDGTLAKAISGYGAAYRDEKNREMADLKAQVTEQTQKTVADMLKRNDQDTGSAEYRLNLVAASRARGQKMRQYNNPDAVGAGLNGLYDSLGEFMQACHADPRRLQGKAAEKHQTLLAYSSNVPDQGGILIPEEFRSDIFTGPALEQAVVRPNATVVPMKTSKLKYPAIDFTTEVGEIWGGIIFYWMDEEGTIPDTSAGFAALELNAHRLAGAALVPNDLMKDVGALTTWLMTNLPKGCLNEEDKAFMKGDGVKKPLGGLHADNPALIAVAIESGQTSGITWNNILAMYARFLPDSYSNGMWVAAPNTIPEIYTMALPVGTGGSAVMVGDDPGLNGSTRLPQTILGMPLRVSRKAPAGLNTQGDISLVDWSTYLVGDTQDVRVESSEHYKFLEDKTAFKVVERVDGQPQLLTALTPEYGGDTLSSFVQLASRP